MSISADTDELPNGPGLLVRWLVATPLWLIAFVGVLVGYVFVHAWGTHKADEAFHRSVSFWRVHSVAEQFSSDLNAYLPFYGWLLLGVIVLLVVNRHRVTTWIWIIPIPTFLMAIGMALVVPTGADRLTGWSKLVVDSRWTVGAAAMVVSLLLTWLAITTLTRPLSGDIAASSMEIPIPSRGRNLFRPRLLVQRDQLTLDRLPTSSGCPTGRFVIPLRALEFTQAGELHAPTVWRTPGEFRMELPEGQVVRIVGSDQEWFLPVADGSTAVRVLRARVEHRAGSQVPPQAAEISNADWSKARERVAKERDWDRRARWRMPVVGDGRVIALLVAVLCVPLTVLTLPGVHGEWKPISLLGTAFYGVIAIAAWVQYRKLTRLHRFIEEHPNPPGSIPPQPLTRSNTSLEGWIEQPVT